MHNGCYDNLCDVFAMGMVFFGLIEGNFPFRNKKELMNKKLKTPKGISKEQ